jgi:hypothetical protein
MPRPKSMTEPDFFTPECLDNEPECGNDDQRSDGIIG